MRAKTVTVKRARAMRKELTPPEVRLWLRLRQRLPGQPAFRRQHPEEPYILDFYCAAAKLAVEVDGEAHDLQLDYDNRRDAWLGERGILVVRYPARAVMAEPDMVAEQIWEMVAQRVRDLTSSPVER